MSKNTEVDKIFNQMKKQYGDNGIYHLDEIPPYKVISTGSLSLDYTFGIGGIPSNRVGEIAGPPGAGKTTLALHIAEEFLNEFPDKAVGFIDMEHRLEPNWASSFVGDMNRVLVMKPSDAQEATNMYRDLAKSGMVSLQVWDSIGGAPTAQSLVKDANVASFGGNSVAITNFAKFATTLSGKYDFATIGINQTRQDMTGYNQHIVPGGMAWQFACSWRLLVKPAPKGGGKAADKGEVFQMINGEELRVGYLVTAKLVKSSMSPPGRVANYWFYNIENDLGFGIDHVEEVARLAKLTGVVESAGSWLNHPLLPGGKLQGLSQLHKFLAKDEGVRKQLAAQTMAKMKSGDVDMSEIIPMDADPESGIADEIPMGAKTIQQIRAEA